MHIMGILPRFVKNWFAAALFSDADINDAAKTVITDLEHIPSLTDKAKETIMQNFVKSFEIGWNAMKSVQGASDQEVNKKVGEIGIEKHAILEFDYLGGDITNKTERFGRSFAVLAGILKFTPNYALTVSGYVIRGLRALKSKYSSYPRCYEFMREILGEWASLMEKKFEQFEYIEEHSETQKTKGKEPDIKITDPFGKANYAALKGAYESIIKEG